MEYLDLTGCNCIVIILLLFHPMLVFLNDFLVVYVLASAVQFRAFVMEGKSAVALQ